MTYYIATFLTSDNQEVSVRFKEKTDGAARKRAQALTPKQTAKLPKSGDVPRTCTLQKLVAHGKDRPYIAGSPRGRVVGLGD